MATVMWPLAAWLAKWRHGGEHGAAANNEIIIF